MPNISNNSQTKHTPVGFTGLTSKMSNHIIPRQESLDAMEKDGPQKGMIGNLPYEFMQTIISTTPKKDLAEKILKTKQAFINASNILRELDSEPVNIKEIINIYIDTLVNGDKKGAEAIKADLKKGFLPISPARMQQYAEKAAKQLALDLQSTGVLPKDSTIKIENRGQGMFGNAYKISFKDANNQNIYSSKIIKVYKDFAVKDKMLSEIPDATQKYFSDEYFKKLSGLNKEYPSLSYEEKNNISSKCFELNIALLNCKNNPINKAVFDAALSKMHGIHAEANRSMYIQKANGQNISRTNQIQPYFFDLQGMMGTFEFREEGMPYPTKIKYIEDIGLKNGDIIGTGELNPENFISGVNIDCGGLTVQNEIIADNKVARRVYKIVARLSRESKEKALEYWKKQYELASQHKLAQSEDVLLGLNEAKKLISQD